MSTTANDTATSFSYDEFKIAASIPYESQNRSIITWLHRGKRLTGLKAIALFGCLSLSKRVSELRKQGYPIEKRMLVLPSGKRIAEYYITSKSATNEQ